MAVIQEVYELVDRFTAPFTRFISLSEKAAGSASAVQRAALELGRSQQAAAELALSSYSEAAAASQAQQSAVDSLGRRMSELNAQMDASRQKLEEMANSGLKGSQEYQALDNKAAHLAKTLVELNAQYNAASVKAGAAAQAARNAAQTAADASQTFASSMETASSGAFSGKSERTQAYVQEMLAVQSQLQRANVELNVHQQMLAAVSAAQGGASSEAAELAGELADLAAETMSLKDRQSALRAALEQAAGGGRKANAAIRQYERTAKSAASSTSGLVDQVKRLAAAYLGLRGMKAVVGQADTMSQITARLNMMNDGLQTTAQLNEMIFQSAQRSRGIYADTAAFVAKLGSLAGDAFSSNGELIAFAEQINKQMTLSGTSSAEAQGAMLQLTQALASGVLRGEELNSVLEQTPMIAQTIARYMGVNTGQMRELASEGAVTAQVVKNAMLSAAEETNAAFAEMPMTWGQMATAARNILVHGFQPVLGFVSSIPQAVIDNTDLVIAALLGVGAVLAVVGTMAMASGIKTAAAFLLPHWPILLLGIAVSAFAYGMLEAGATASDVLGMVGAGFGWLYAFVGNIVVNLYNLWISFAEFFVNFSDDMLGSTIRLFFNFADTILGIVQTIAGALDAVFGWNLESKVSGFRSSINQWVSDTIGSNPVQLQRLEQISYEAAMTDFGDFGRNFGASISNFGNSMGNSGAVPGFLSYDELTGPLNDISKDVGKISKTVSLSNEDLKSLVDMAERKYVNNINLTAQSPVINVQGQNTGSTARDRKALADTIKEILIEQAAAGSTLSTARV